ncbi:hypothetical protein [Massilia phosphatilytica]
MNNFHAEDSWRQSKSLLEAMHRAGPWSRRFFVPNKLLDTLIQRIRDDAELCRVLEPPPSSQDPAPQAERRRDDPAADAREVEYPESAS